MRAALPTAELTGILGFVAIVDGGGHLKARRYCRTGVGGCQGFTVAVHHPDRNSNAVPGALWAVFSPTVTEAIALVTVWHDECVIAGIGASEEFARAHAAYEVLQLYWDALDEEE